MSTNDHITNKLASSIDLLLWVTQHRAAVGEEKIAALEPALDDIISRVGGYQVDWGVNTHGEESPLDSDESDWVTDVPTSDGITVEHNNRNRDQGVDTPAVTNDNGIIAESGAGGKNWEGPADKKSGDDDDDNAVHERKGEIPINNCEVTTTTTTMVVAQRGPGTLKVVAVPSGEAYVPLREMLMDEGVVVLVYDLDNLYPLHTKLSVLMSAWYAGLIVEHLSVGIVLPLRSRFSPLLEQVAPESLFINHSAYAKEGGPGRSSGSAARSIHLTIALGLSAEHLPRLPVANVVALGADARDTEPLLNALSADPNTSHPIDNIRGLLQMRLWNPAPRPSVRELFWDLFKPACISSDAKYLKQRHGPWYKEERFGHPWGNDTLFNIWLDFGAVLPAGTKLTKHLFDAAIDLLNVLAARTGTLLLNPEKIVNAHTVNGINCVLVVDELFDELATTEVNTSLSQAQTPSHDSKVSLTVALNPKRSPSNFPFGNMF